MVALTALFPPALVTARVPPSDDFFPEVAWFEVAGGFVEEEDPSCCRALVSFALTISPFLWALMSLFRNSLSRVFAMGVSASKVWCNFLIALVASTSFLQSLAKWPRPLHLQHSLGLYRSPFFWALPYPGLAHVSFMVS